MSDCHPSPVLFTRSPAPSILAWMPARQLFLLLLLGGLLAAPACKRRGPQGAISDQLTSEIVVATPMTVQQAGVPREELILRMPFRAGEVVLCAQGNRSQPGTTHSLPQNFYALDFSARGVPRVDVVSAAGGRVAHVVRSSPQDDKDAGGGYGNQVWLDHGEHLFTLYAHLDEVFVQMGEDVPTGALLGTMGRTGLAQDRHLHFSLEFVSGQDFSESVNFPLEALVTMDMRGAQAFRVWRGVEFVAHPELPWSGGLYGSENDGSPAPHLGAPAPALTGSLTASLATLEPALRRRLRLEEFANREKIIAAADARALLTRLSSEAPDDPVLLYDWAVAVQMPARDWVGAASTLRRAEEHGRKSRWFEAWLPAWVENQLGRIALEQQNTLEADAHFARATKRWPDPSVTRFAAQERARTPRSETSSLER